MNDEKELLKKASLPGEIALKHHEFYHGKIEVIPKCLLQNLSDFSIWYTPGVAEPCKAIKENPEKVYDYTNKWNNVAIITDGTRVLGLGDIGAEASLPVMEGKALLFKFLGGVDAFPICLSTTDSSEIVKVVNWIQPSFGGINLEDIAQPKCFKILFELRRNLKIPVWHDDQQGTGTVVLAGLINALKIVNKKINEVQIALIGAGAAGLAIANILTKAGATLGKLIIVDSKGILHPSRVDLQEEKKYWALKTNKEDRVGGIYEAVKNSDVCIAVSKPGPKVITEDMIKKMADNPIVFACANPIPEIWPWEAKKAGAKIVATGRSDFPNQINNSLGFPGIFRGTLDVRAKTITDEMCIAAAYEIAKVAEEKGLTEDYIIPSMDEFDVYPREASAVAEKAVEENIARIKLTREEAYEKACLIIKKAQEKVKCLMKMNFIKSPPKINF
ncbi:NADP-dependent malic enzyme [Candidatus Bathyarchaeota archaeon]|nr:NADP-dependent malic enzyme [Candidatus Bathyarchaeota archaeon]